ncbi:hypothetical protein [Apilactobacillus kunkeei]|uniref:hypothetical protein n=1 Tax=Apilactobacillus kunkeei TaxID=148814 RepID=UPI001786EB09|nr:hypothetical protein [Apilactobacillus kunkeei]
MQKHTFITWYSGSPLAFSYNVRYKKVGHNQFTFLYNIHKIKDSMLLGEKMQK